jgi:hypothetical protein
VAIRHRRADEDRDQQDIPRRLADA